MDFFITHSVVALDIYPKTGYYNICNDEENMKEDYADPKAQSKLHLYFDLLERGANPNFTALDVPLPGGEFGNHPYADIVIFKDYDHSIADLVIECLPVGATSEQIDTARSLAEAKATFLHAPLAAYAVGKEVYRFSRAGR